MKYVLAATLLISACTTQAFESAPLVTQTQDTAPVDSAPKDTAPSLTEDAATPPIDTAPPPLDTVQPPMDTAPPTQDTAPPAPLTWEQLQRALCTRGAPRTEWREGRCWDGKRSACGWKGTMPAPCTWVQSADVAYCVLFVGKKYNDQGCIDEMTGANKDVSGQDGIDWPVNGPAYAAAYLADGVVVPFVAEAHANVHETGRPMDGIYYPQCQTVRLPQQTPVPVNTYGDAFVCGKTAPSLPTTPQEAATLKRETLTRF